MENRENLRHLRFNAAQFQTRADESGDLYISGYFSVFNSEYEICPGATESISETAFDGALSDDIRCLVNHDSTLVLGRTKAGTLTLKVPPCRTWRTSPPIPPAANPTAGSSSNTSAK